MGAPGDDEQIVWLTQWEAMRRLRCSASKIEKLRQAGELPYRPGRPVMIRADAVDAYLQRKEEARQRRIAEKNAPLPPIDLEDVGRMLALKAKARRTDDPQQRGALLSRAALIASPERRVERARRQAALDEMLTPKQLRPEIESPIGVAATASEADRWLTQNEVAAMLRRSIWTIQRLREMGELPYRRGRPVMIRLSAVRAYEARTEIQLPRLSDAPIDPRQKALAAARTTQLYNEGKRLARKAQRRSNADR